MIEFILETITLENFRSFREKQTFKLDRDPGLYYITGINQVDDLLGANGVGKTSLLGGVCWIFFGKTIEGIKGPDIKNWDSDEICKGTLKFRKNDKPYTLTRTQGPNSLTISPAINSDKEEQILTQSEVDNFLNISYEKFLYAFIVGQFNLSFLELGPTDKLNLFSEIMGLEVWEQASKQASTQAAESQNSLNLLESQKSGIQSRIQTLEGESAHLRVSSDGFETERQVKLQKLQKSQADLTPKLRDLGCKELRCQTTIKDLPTQIIGFEADLERITESIGLINTDLSAIKTLIATSNRDKANAVKEYGKWKGLDVCPYCTSNVSPEMTTQYKNDSLKQQIEINKNLRKYEAQQKGLEEQLAASELGLKEAKDNLKITQTRLTQLTQEQNKLASSRQLIQQESTQTLQSIEVLGNQTNPYVALYENAIEQAAISSQELQQLAGQIEELTRAVTGSQYWTKGFKEMRQWLISDALAALEIESNRALVKLGLPNWEIKYQMERETTTGGISKGFHVLIHPPTAPADRYIPFEVWSGGERQRLKLAATQGLMAIIQTHQGISFNLEIYDEPTHSLSDLGVEGLIQLLADGAEDTGKVVYYIDHKAIENPRLKGIINIVKRKEGSRIVENE